MLNLDWLSKQQRTKDSVESLQGYDGVLAVRKKLFGQQHNKIHNITSLHKNLPENHIQSLLSHITEGYYLIIPKSDKKKLMSIRQTIINEPKLKIRIMDNDFWPQKQEILIFGNTVAFGNIEDHQSFSVFENHNMAKVMKNIFITLWSFGKRF